jgi:hypothetical protein
LPLACKVHCGVYTRAFAISLTPQSALVRIPIFAFDAPATFSLGTGSRADGIGYFSSSTMMPASFRICLMLMSIDDLYVRMGLAPSPWRDRSSSCCSSPIRFTSRCTRRSGSRRLPRRCRSIAPRPCSACHARSSRSSARRRKLTRLLCRVSKRDFARACAALAR